MSDVKRVFHYNACAHALSGRLTRPVQHEIEVQAATSLPTIGGHGNSRVENFRVKEFISVKAAYSHVSGSEHVGEDGKVFHTTLSTATLEGLNILDVITADRVVARVSAFWVEPNYYTHFNFSGSHFENLKIAGCPVTANLESRLVTDLPTFPDVIKEDKDLCGETKIDPLAGVMHCTLLNSITGKIHGMQPTRHEHIIKIPHFGEVFLAEVLVEPNRRTLTMIRLVLGSPVGGTVIGGQTAANGRTYPPVPPPDDGN
jgi:hypothetical protein